MYFITRKNIITMVMGILISASCVSAKALDDHKDSETNKNDNVSSKIHNAWMQGKLETVYILNKHLSSFDINTEIVNDKALLSGQVESSVERDLAEELALSIEGINKVDNDIKINKEINSKNSDLTKNQERSFWQIVEDVTTTATVKSKMIFGVDMDGNATSINVDTKNGVVTLTGNVDSSRVKDLAEKSAQNINGVKGVKNYLKISNHS